MSFSVTVAIKDGNAEVTAHSVPADMNAIVMVSGHKDDKWYSFSASVTDQE